MAQLQQNHVKPITSGFVGLLVLAVVGIGILNAAANRRGR